MTHHRLGHDRHVGSNLHVGSGLLRSALHLGSAVRRLSFMALPLVALTFAACSAEEAGGNLPQGNAGGAGSGGAPAVDDPRATSTATTTTTVDPSNPFAVHTDPFAVTGDGSFVSAYSDDPMTCTGANQSDLDECTPVAGCWSAIRCVKETKCSSWVDCDNNGNGTCGAEFEAIRDGMSNAYIPVLLAPSCS